MNRPGRPRGESGARDAILAAARALFAESGYERASIRAIARRAGVDPALVHHYFGTKDELLGAAVRLPVDPTPIFARAFEHPEAVGESLIRSILSLWDTPDVRDRMLALLRAAVTHPGAAGILRNVLTRDVLTPATERIGLPDAELRVELVGTQSGRPRDGAVRPGCRAAGQRVRGPDSPRGRADAAALSHRPGPVPS